MSEIRVRIFLYKNNRSRLSFQKKEKCFLSSHVVFHLWLCLMAIVAIVLSQLTIFNTMPVPTHTTVSRTKTRQMSQFKKLPPPSSSNMQWIKLTPASINPSGFFGFITGGHTTSTAFMCLPPYWLFSKKEKNAYGVFGHCFLGGGQRPTKYIIDDDVERRGEEGSAIVFVIWVQDSTTLQNFSYV